MIVTLVQWVINALAGAIGAVVALLPTSPFTNVGVGSLSTYLGYVAYFVPIHSMVVLGGAWLSAMAVWYGVRWALRFARMVQ